MASVPAEAVQVLQAFFDASNKKDIEGMKACLSRQTLEADGFTGAGPEGVQFTLGEGHMEGDNAIITADGSGMVMQCIMVKEDGQWKFDLATTMDRMMSGLMNSTIGKVAETMQSVTEEVGHAIATALHGTSAREEKSWDSASLTPQVDELFALPPMTPLPQTASRVSQALGIEAHVDAAIDDLLKQLHSDDKGGLIEWMDGSLFAKWGDAFAKAAGISVGDRLWTIRIEPCEEFSNRILILDGSDLVYRLNFNDVSGYFTDAFIGQVVPGLLAGLPEQVDTAVAGRRMLPLDGERPTVEYYRQRWMPRWMRRIRQLLGTSIDLEIDWPAIDGFTNVGIQLPRWGLNRVYGGLALACLDENLKSDLPGRLKSIRLDVGPECQNKYARLEGGTLVVGISFANDDTPGCYEYEIADAVRGT